MRKRKKLRALDKHMYGIETGQKNHMHLSHLTLQHALHTCYKYL